MSQCSYIFQDSGGFQMVSLLELAEITEEGVRFKSPHDGSMMMLTPEHSMAIQNSIGTFLHLYKQQNKYFRHINYHTGVCKDSSCSWA